VLQGSMMAIRAVGTAFWSLLSKFWYFIRRRRKKMDGDNS
jgi:hypothetical protein